MHRHDATVDLTCRCQESSEVVSVVASWIHLYKDIDTGYAEPDGVRGTHSTSRRPPGALVGCDFRLRDIEPSPQETDRATVDHRTGDSNSPCSRTALNVND